jgi:hypothetical protein
MKKRTKITDKICLMLLLFAALAMIMLPFQAWAQDADSDNDGILDTEEGLCLPSSYPNLCSYSDSETADLSFQ